MQDKFQGCKVKPPQQLCTGSCVLWGISETLVSQNHPEKGALTSPPFSEKGLGLPHITSITVYGE